VGEVAVWREAAMLSAQVTAQNKTKIGINTPEIEYNYQLLLNIIY